MNILDDSEHQSQWELSDNNMLPFSNDHDKIYSILNVLRGHEEFTLNTDGTIISSNLEAVNITCYEEWEVIGKHFSIFYTEEDVSNRQPEMDLELSIKEGKFSSESWKVKKRHIRFWARTKIIPLRDSLHTLRGYKVILRDATHKVFSDFNVQKIKNEYLNLYHNSIFGILRFNKKEGTITLANKKALQILGINDFHDFLFRDAFLVEEEYIRFNAMVHQQRYVNNFEFQLKHANGAKRWASLDCKFYVSNGLIEGIIIDVTDKKTRELELHKLSNDLNTFIYHASHDLRSPLTSIMGLLNLMDLGETDNSKQYSAMIRDRIGHLDNLLKDLSTIAFNSHSEVNRERVFLREEIDFMLRDFITDNKIKFVLDINEDVIFNSDVLRFRTILKNLISNSIKYHNQMEKNPFVRITTLFKADILIIEIEDNGIGIERAEMEKIYKMFHRGHSSRSGSGLGLYTVRSMVDKLGGTVQLSSIIGKGTKVTLEFPSSIR